MKKQEAINLYGDNLANAPLEIFQISRKWTRLANEYGDKGSCVLGAGFSFTYHDKNYFLPPMSQWQGSCSWEHYKDEIQEDLKKIGCENIYYDWGVMD